MYFCSTRRSSDEGMWEKTVVARKTGMGGGGWDGRKAREREHAGR